MVTLLGGVSVKLTFAVGAGLSVIENEPVLPPSTCVVIELLDTVIVPAHSLHEQHTRA